MLCTFVSIADTSVCNRGIAINWDFVLSTKMARRCMGTSAESSHLADEYLDSIEPLLIILKDEDSNQ